MPSYRDLLRDAKSRITEILRSEIKTLDLSSIDQVELRAHIESLLGTMIDKVAKKSQRNMWDCAK